MNPTWVAIFIVVLYYHPNDATECTARGRFPNLLSNDCRGYSMCLSVLENFTRIDLVCPEHSIYSHLDNQCTNVTSYQCLPEYNCTEVGNFKNPSDCSSYISCVGAFGDIATARLVECLPEMMFDPSVNACVSNTIFNCGKSIPVTTTTTTKVYEVPVKNDPTPIDSLLRGSGSVVKVNHVICILLVFMMSIL